MAGETESAIVSIKFDACGVSTLTSRQIQINRVSHDDDIVIKELEKHASGVPKPFKHSVGICQEQCHKDGH
jgi:hypothetical protein